MKKNKGMTLIELMIVVSIIGILGAIGYPAFGEYVKTAKRADGIKTLLTEAGRAEDYYLNNDTYVAAAVASGTSPDGHYTIAISGQTAFVYTLTATRTPSSEDPECLTLTLNQLGQKGATGSDASNCW